MSDQPPATEQPQRSEQTYLGKEILRRQGSEQPLATDANDWAVEVAKALISIEEPDDEWIQEAAKYLRRTCQPQQPPATEQPQRSEPDLSWQEKRLELKQDELPPATDDRPPPIPGPWLATQSTNPAYPHEWDVKEGGKSGYSVIGEGFITEGQAKEIALRHNLTIHKVAPATDDKQTKLSEKQKELLREVWGETVSRVKPLIDLDSIAEEWLVLAAVFDDYRREADDRYRLHAGAPKAND